MRSGPHFHFITLFPETIRIWFTTSILHRAHTAGLFDFSLHQLRDFTEDRHRSVDDTAYGGGGGMVLKVEPLVRAVESIRKASGRPIKVIYFSPAGKKLNHALILEEKRQWESETPDFILVCGHYEGIDQRFLDHWVDLEISLGDFVLTGGEIPAVAFADSFIRQIEGTLGDADGHLTESFALKHENRELLEYPHYTRPAEFRNLSVPPVLLSGDHARIAQWRLEKSIEKTGLSK